MLSPKDTAQRLRKIADRTKTQLISTLVRLPHGTARTKVELRGGEEIGAQFVGMVVARKRLYLEGDKWLCERSREQTQPANPDRTLPFTDEVGDEDSLWRVRIEGKFEDASHLMRRFKVAVAECGIFTRFPGHSILSAVHATHESVASGPPRALSLHDPVVTTCADLVLALTTLLDGTPEQDARHSSDFASVNWYGTLYEFTETQAACVAVLWKEWENKTPTVGEAYILTEAEAATPLRVLFHKHAAWKKMIVPATGKGGRFRLADPPR